MCDLASFSRLPASISQCKSLYIQPQARCQKIRERIRDRTLSANNREQTTRSGIGVAGSRRQQYFVQLCIDSKYDFM